MKNQLSPETLEFLANWQITMYIATQTAILLAVLIYILYKVWLRSIKDSKRKYDFIALHEFKFLIVSHILIAIAIFLICNTYKEETVKLSMVWFSVRLFISLCLGTLYGYIAQLVLMYYYPKKQHKKLRNLRYKPRINPANGNEMKLLSEEEEDAFLDEGMQAEEDVFSVDYDVWIDVETGDTKIEKYEGRLTALKCDRCGFQTLKLNNEEIVKEADDDNDGELLKEYKCTYCKRIRRKTIKLSNNKSETDFQLTEHTKFVDNPLGEPTKVVAVKLELYSNKDDVHKFEFQNLNEASKFLKEFKFEPEEESEEEDDDEFDKTY
jgi:hypothetical protein